MLNFFLYPPLGWSVDVWDDAVPGTTKCSPSHGGWWHSHHPASPRWPSGDLASRRRALPAANSLCWILLLAPVRRNAGE